MNLERLRRAQSIVSAAWRDGGLPGTIRTVANYVSWRMRDDRLQRQLRAVRKEPWMPAMMRAQAAVWEAGEDYYRDRYQTDEIHYWTMIARWVHEYSRSKAMATSLDVGSGFGTLAVFLTEIFGRPAAACDMHRREGVDRLVEQGLLTFHQCNVELEEMPVSGPFDVIVFTEVLEHLNFDPIPTLRKLRNALDDEGHLFLSTPDAAEWGRVTSFYASLSDMPSPSEGKRLVEAGQWQYVDDHVWQYTKEELEDVVRRSGFTVLRWDYAPGVAYRHFNLELVKATG